MKKIQIWTLAALAGTVLAFSGCGGSGNNTSDSAVTESQSKKDVSDQVATADEMSGTQEVGTKDMKAISASSLKEGEYEISVDSSSSMFRIESCMLKVSGGKMSAVMTMGGTGYLKVFMGTGEEAALSSANGIPYQETAEGKHTFEVPVEALDQEISCAAFSKNKEKWYDRTLVFRADSLPQDAFVEGVIPTVKSLGLKDGTYSVEVKLEGGSGRASVTSPANLKVKDGKAVAEILWSSPNYDYMKVNGKKYQQLAKDGNSMFEIPVSGFDWKIPVIADTTAMSEPHEISYTLHFDSSTIKAIQE